MSQQRPLHAADINRVLKGVDRGISDLARAAHRQEFVITRTSKGHVRVMTPPGVPKQIHVMPSTPSDFHSVRNARSNLRKIGVELPRS